VVLTVAIILFLFLPHPADLVVLGLGVIGEVGEIVWGRRLAKRWRPKTGPEAMIGTVAEVVEPCRPVGQVRVHGELWEARCAAGAEVGASVWITALEGLTLTVSPTPDGGNAVAPATPAQDPGDR
jgi:membrane protein implicated in regulation of membrane protease activity